MLESDKVKEIRGILQQEIKDVSMEMYMRGFEDCCESLKRSFRELDKLGFGKELTAGQVCDLIEDIKEQTMEEKK